MRWNDNNHFVNDDHFLFECSGRRAYSSSAILGISSYAWPMAEEDMVIFYGNDGGLELKDRAPLSKEEMREVADHMIARWREWRDRHCGSE